MSLPNPVLGAPLRSILFDDNGATEVEFDNEMAEEKVMKSLISFKVIMSENYKLVSNEFDKQK